MRQLLFILLLLNNGISMSKDNDSILLPMWSKGLAKTCCNIFPSQISSKGFFEHGALSDSTYYTQRTVKSGDTVYVVTSDLPHFILNVFQKLNPSDRITLVSGCEDIGQPYEIFHPNRPNFFDYKMSALWPSGLGTFSMESFIGDSRLVKWFLQNYDAVGCNLYTCSNLNNIRHQHLLSKLEPIPIGLDFHSFIDDSSVVISEEADKLSLFKKSKVKSYLSQFKDMMAIKLVGRSFKDRVDGTIVVSFECKFDKSRIGMGRRKTRGELCDILHTKSDFLPSNSLVFIDGISLVKSFTENIENRRIKTGIDSLINKINSTEVALIEHLNNILLEIENNDDSSSKWNQKEKRRLRFWLTLSISKFALAPSGFGIDTHRIWEILEFGCVPITVSSPMDTLYSQYPIIILRSWSELSDSLPRVNNIISSYMKNITLKFGTELILNATVQRMLTLTYWNEKIRSSKELLMI